MWEGGEGELVNDPLRTTSNLHMHAYLVGMYCIACLCECVCVCVCVSVCVGMYCMHVCMLALCACDGQVEGGWTVAQSHNNLHSFLSM